MLKLDDKDLRLLLAAIVSLNSDFDPKTLPGRALSLLEAIVPSDCSSFDFFTSDNSYDTTAWTNRPDIATPENMAVFAAHMHEHKLIPIALKRRDGVAMKMTDVVRQGDFERTGLFNEFYRVHGLSRQMGTALPVAADLTVSCVATKGGKRDFSERDRAMMTLATPHLLNAMQNAAAYRRIERALNSGGSGFAAFESSGRMIFATELVRDLSAAYFPDDERDGNGLPDAVIRWMNEQLATADGEPHVPGPLSVLGRHGVLYIRLMANSGSGERNLIFEEKRFPTSERAVSAASLTKRESEVLFWLTKGKTNGTIAEICGISLRTVHKHVEHIYQKLGVETRTAAIMRGLDVM